MPANPRVRGNNVFGTTIDNPLLAGASTMNSLGLANLPAVIAQHATITLDPLRQFGEPEIVVVTSHTASSTIATIIRGQYGTVARDHPESTTWVHAPLDEDFIEILTSGTRPSDPYRGQAIFETDTNRFVARSTADIWQQYGLFFDPPACRVFSNATQNALNSTITYLSFNSERYDTDNMHDNAINPTRITINTAGLYLITGHMAWPVDNDYTRRLLDFEINTAAAFAARTANEGAANLSNPEGWSVSTVWKFSAGDFIRLRIFQSNTSAGTAVIPASSNGYECEFSATWIGRGN